MVKHNMLAYKCQMMILLQCKQICLRFKSSIKELSNEKMIINYDSYVINEPIKTLSHDEDNGFLYQLQMYMNI